MLPSASCCCHVISIVLVQFDPLFEPLGIFKNLDFYHPATLSPSLVHVSLPLVSSFKSLIMVNDRTCPASCATHSGSPPGWPGSLAQSFGGQKFINCTVFHLSKNIRRKLLLLKSKYTASTLFPEVNLTWLSLNPCWLPSPNYRNQTFIINSNILPKFYTKHTCPKLETGLYCKSEL